MKPDTISTIGTDEQHMELNGLIACRICHALMQPLVRLSWDAVHGVRCIHHCRTCNCLAIESEYRKPRWVELL